MSILVTANARPALGTFGALNRQLAYSVQRAGRANEVLNRTLTGIRFAAVGAAGGLGGAVVAATRFENSFADVRKTVEGSEKDFRKINKGLRDLSEKIPESASGLAELAGEAGALGIPAGQITKFTKVASMLGTTTDLSAIGAADALARVANIMNDKTVPAYKEMGNVLVELGNKGASTEQEVAEFAKRIAGAGQAVDLETHQVFGLGAALANVGLRAEMGGTAMDRILLSMQAAIGKGGKELQQFADITGISTQKFSKMFEDDATVAIAEFARGLERLKGEGKPVAVVLDGLGKAASTSLNEIRVRQTLLRVMGNVEEFERAQKLANKEMKEGTALSVEAEKRYETLSSQLQLLVNSVVRVGIDLGTKLLPDIKELVATLRDPKLTLGEKADAVFDKIGDLLAKAIPEAAKIGGQIGFALAGGVLRGFVEADTLGKLFIGASLIRLFGGPGVLLGAGSAIAGLLTRPIVHGFHTALQFGIARSVAGFQRGAIGIKGFDKRTAGVLGGRLMSHVGPGVASALAFTTTNAIPLAFAGAGLINIMSDVLGGDLRGAAFESGGALAGALAGGVIGGVPGALIGGGLGTVVGDVLDDIFRSKDTRTPVERFHDTIKENAEKASARVAEIGKELRTMDRGIRRARRRQAETADAVEEAERKATRARRQYGARSRQAAKAEADLATAKLDNLRASRKLRDVERLSGPERKLRRLELREEGGPIMGDFLEAQARLQEAQDAFNEAWQRRPRGDRDAAIEYLEDFEQPLSEAKAEFGEARRKVLELQRTAQQGLGKKFAGKLRKDLRSLGNIDRLSEGIEEVLRPKLEEQLRGAGGPRGTRRSELDVFRTKLENVGEVADDLAVGALRRLRKANDETGEQGESAADRIRDAYDNLPPAVRTAIDLLEGDTGKALLALGKTRIGFGVTGKRAEARRMAGGVVPGHTAGDAHIAAAKVESGEGLFVLNRNAMGMFQEWNDLFPRRQKGGPGGIVALGKQLQRQGYHVSEHPAFGGVNFRHADGSFHYSGQALDINADHFPGGEKAALDRLYARLLNVPGIVELLWQVADHFDHLHVAMTGAGGPLGFLGGAFKLPKPQITGPEGALRTLGQAAVDKVHQAARARVMKEQASLASLPHGSFTPGSGKGNFLSTAYGPPWGGIQGQGVTATGVNLLGSPQIFGIAVDPSVIPLGSRVKVAPNPHGTSSRFLAFDTGGAIKGNRIDFYDWRGRDFQNAWGRRPVTVKGFQRGGLIPEWAGWHGRGGSFEVRGPTVFGAGERGPEQVSIRRKGEGSRIELHFHGKQARAALATLDDVYAIVDGERVEVERHHGQMARMKKGR